MVVRFFEKGSSGVHPQKPMMRIAYFLISPIFLKCNNFPYFPLFSFFVPALTMMHLRIMLNMFWTPSKSGNKTMHKAQGKLHVASEILIFFVNTWNIKDTPETKNFGNK